MTNEDLSELITYSTALINVDMFNKTVPSGTGFFINLCNSEDNSCIPVLMTNKHVIEGTTSFSFDMCHMDEKGKPIDTQVETYKFNNTGWIMHPSPDVDLCCFPIGRIANSKTSNGFHPYYRTFSTDLIPNQKQLSDFNAIEDIFMVGYPTGVFDHHNHKPVFRKGITATHLKHNYCGKKEFLIDCPCFKGSSGSPIFMLNQGSYHDKNTSSIVIGSRFHLLGVLSKTHLANLIEVEKCSMDANFVYTIPNNLGIVIKAELILDFETILNEMFLS